MRSSSLSVIVLASLASAGISACCNSGDSAKPETPAESTAAPAVSAATTTTAANTTVPRITTTATTSASAHYPPGTTPFGSLPDAGFVPPHGTATGTATAPPTTTGRRDAFGAPPPIATSNKK